MCGFLGQLNLSAEHINDFELSSLLSLSKHRGPDHTHKWVSEEGNIWIGFNRLAIQDLSVAGIQPMLNRNRRYVIVFNGEIYNHLELRKLLPDTNWNGHSDTETILVCIEQWGFLKTIELLDGMFAIVLYDSLEKSLFLARDFAGIKPLFFGWNGKSFVFSSQFDQLQKHPSFRNNPINHDVLKLYLKQHFVPAPFGLIQGTGQLEPGQWCKVSSKGLEKGFYWQFPEFQEPEIFSQKEGLEIIHLELENAVKMQMISDVPLGAFLSGGIDSPLVCHYAQKFSESKLKTFTIGSDSSVHDESALAQKFSDLIGTKHSLKKTALIDLLTSFEEVMQVVHEPFADFSVIPTLWISKLARQDVTVALSGDGGDELFFGYERFWSVAKNLPVQQLPFILKLFLYKWDQYSTGNKRLNSVLLSRSQSAAHQGLHSRFQDAWVNKLFPYLRNTILPDDYTTYKYKNSKCESELLQSMRKAEFYGMMQKTLRKVDLASMGASLEIRVPFLKKTFIESSLRLDYNLSYGPNQKKQLLKNLLTKIYPEAPVDNIKRGFTVPLAGWMRQNDFIEHLKDNYLYKISPNLGVDKKVIDEMINFHLSGRDHKWELFTLVSLGNMFR